MALAGEKRKNIENKFMAQPIGNEKI